MWLWNLAVLSRLEAGRAFRLGIMYAILLDVAQVHLYGASSVKTQEAANKWKSSRPPASLLSFKS